MPLDKLPFHDLTGPLVRGVGEGGGASPGVLVTDWTNGTRAVTSANAGEALTLDATTPLRGKPTIKCTFSATAGTYIANITLATPMRLAGIVALQIPIKFTSGASADGGVGLSATPFQVWLMLSDSSTVRFPIRFDSLRAGVWNTLSVGRGAAWLTSGTFANLDAAGVTVTKIQIVQATTGATAASNPVWVGEIRVPVRRCPGRVSIVMDGVYSSQYSILKPYLDSYGIRTSLAITKGNIGSASYMTEAQIAEMYAAGHECIHHTYDSTKTNGYVNATDWPTAAAITADINAQWAYFTTQGWTRGIGHAVWAYAPAFVSTTTQARQDLVRDGMLAAGVVSCRYSVPVRTDPGNCLTPLLTMPVDKTLGLLGAIQITNTDTAAAVKAVIDKAEARGEWAIITIHRAVTDATTPASLEMKESDFADWLGYLKQRIDAGGVICAPQSEVVATMPDIS